MKQGRKTSLYVIPIAAALLLALTIILLVSLGSPPDAPVIAPHGQTGKVAQPTAAAEPTPPAAAEPGPRKAPAPPTRASGPPAETAGATLTPAPPRHVRAPAPPAVPAEIRDEKDPQRKAQLLRMHRVAMARVRVSSLRRRARLLERTLATAREEGSADRIQQLENEMAQLLASVREAERELERADRETGTQ